MSESASPGDTILLHSARQLLTLIGPAGPRRGPEMQDLAIIPDGSLLIRNGVIEDVGPTRRLANLVRAKRARTIDVTGRVVLPAFVDPDAPLVTQALSSAQRARLEKNAAPSESLRVMSRRRMEMRAGAMIQALASYGVLVTGSSTVSADDPRNVLRILTVYKALQSSPLRIRPVLTWPPGGSHATPGTGDNTAEWLNTVRARDLAPVVEFAAGSGDTGAMRNTARIAMQRAFAVRVRTVGALDEETVELARASGAIAVHASPASAPSRLRELADVNCVFVAGSPELIGCDPGATGKFNSAIDAGLPVAIASAFRSGVPASLNAQFNLHLACSRLQLTPEQAITAATHNAASALGFADSAGSLAPGRPADLVVMDVPDFRELILRAGHHDVLMVMRAGRVIYRRAALTLD